MQTSDPGQTSSGNRSRFLRRPGLRVYWRFARPFTLMVPAIGMLSGACIALGADPRFISHWAQAPLAIARNMGLGALMAAVLNVASNGLNQIFDLDIDRINKPHRPLPAGELTIKQAGTMTAICFTFGLMLALAVNIQCFVLALSAFLLTSCYSVPPFRTKRWALAANLTVAMPRGTLLIVAGWSTVKSVWNFEPWYIGAIFGLFIFGANNTKDFSDVDGDRAGNCLTWPVKYGARRTAAMIAPFFVIPFLFLLGGVDWGILSGNRFGLTSMGILLPLLGSTIAFLMVTQPEKLSSGENHISWKLIYLMVLFSQAGLAISYLL